MDKNTIFTIALIVIMLTCSLVFAFMIANSDLPMWAKWLLLS